MEDYQEYRDTLAKGHDIFHELERSPAESLEDLKKRDAETRLHVERLNAKLKEARDGSRNVIQALHWSGIALILFGGIGMFVRQSWDDSS